MPVDLKIVGGNAMRELSRELKRTGDREVFKRTQKVLADATQPAKDEVRRSALETLPKAGGLNTYVADLKIVARVRVHGRNAGVRLTSTKAKGSHEAHRRRRAKARLKAAGRKQVIRPGTLFGKGLVDLNAIDRGRGKHPTYGHRPWVLQKLPAGFFSRPMNGIVAFRVRKDLIRMIEGLLKELASKKSKAA